MKLFSSKNFKPYSKHMMRIAIPIAISGVIMQIQSLIDTAFLARYTTTLADGSILTGSEILSAVGNVFFPYLVTISFIWSIGTGVVVLVSQRLGANDPQNARKYANAGLKYNTILSCLVYFFWLFLGKKVLILLGVHEPILSVSLEYLRYMSLELFYVGMATSVYAIFQGVGNTKPEMYVGIFRSLLHIVLDYVFIFGHFGAPELGVAGAGIASSVSGLVATTIMMVIFLTIKDFPFKTSFKSLITTPIKPYLKVLKVGLPVGLEDMLWNVGNLVLAYFLNLISAEAVGIYRLVYQIECTPCYFYTGLARAVTTIVGQKTGERKLDAAKESGLIGTFYTLSFCVLFAMSFLVFPKQILSIFTPDLALIQKAAPFLMITAFTMMPRAMNIISGNGIRGYGDTIWMLATQIFGIVFIISLSYALMFPLGLGMYGLFIGMFSDETVRCVINTIRFYRGETSIFHKAFVPEKVMLDEA